MPRLGLKNSNTVENASSPPAEAPKQTIGKGLVGGDVFATTFFKNSFLEVAIGDFNVVSFPFFHDRFIWHSTGGQRTAPITNPEYKWK